MIAQTLTLAEDAAAGGPPPTLPMPTPDCSEEDRPIHEALARGDGRAAIAAMARVHGAALGRLCFVLLRSQAEADEMVQEALLTAYDAMASYRAEGSPRAWVFGIARRLCAKRLEVRTRQARRRDLARDEAPKDGPDALVEGAHDAQILRDALAELRPTEREAVLLRYVSDLSFREVGAACGIEEAAARQRVGRAVARLRERLHDSQPKGR